MINSNLSQIGDAFSVLKIVERKQCVCRGSHGDLYPVWFTAPESAKGANSYVLVPCLQGIAYP